MKRVLKLAALIALWLGVVAISDWRAARRRRELWAEATREH